jgi:hypothetical protein
MISSLSKSAQAIVDMLAGTMPTHQIEAYALSNKKKDLYIKEQAIKRVTDKRVLIKIMLEDKKIWARRQAAMMLDIDKAML